MLKSAVKSVKKKLKDKGFARSVNREEIRQGAADLNMDLGDHIAFVRDAMAQVAEDLGLAGHPGWPRLCIGFRDEVPHAPR